jgi:hypothetical protein
METCDLSSAADRSGFWRIEAYDKDRCIFEKVISVSAFSKLTMRRLLQRLAASRLTEDQIIEASLRRNARGYAAHLEVRPLSAAARYTITCGSNPRFVASVWTRDEITGRQKPT